MNISACTCLIKVKVKVDPMYVFIYQARRNEIDIGGGAVDKANCTGLPENFCVTTPFRLLESNLAIQIAIFNG